jgi:hypothetical protein
MTRYADGQDERNWRRAAPLDRFRATLWYGFVKDFGPS